VDISSKRIKGGCPLPEEIVHDILSHLPARLLCRFRCVSRPFHAVISSRAFQDTHYYHQQQQRRRRLFIRPPGVQEPLYAWRPGAVIPAAAETIMSTRRRLPQGSIFPVSKSCRGLVLLKSTDYDRAHYVSCRVGNMS
jgi:hypothetical protein